MIPGPPLVTETMAFGRVHYLGRIGGGIGEIAWLVLVYAEKDGMYEYIRPTIDIAECTLPPSPSTDHLPSWYGFFFPPL